MKASAIIQARFSSNRLPGKVLLKVLDKTILEYIVERVKKAETIKRIVVATSIKDEDSKIVNVAKGLGVNIFCGSESDVLDRFYQAAKLYNIQHIVRLTADCPLLDPRIIDKGVKSYFQSNADYCSNALERTYPDGEDVEVFSFDVLRRTWMDANLSSEREHVSPYIKKNPDEFRLTNFKHKTNLSSKRWTLDRKGDFEFIKIIIESLYPVNPDFHMEDILDFLRLNPHLEGINKDIIPSEGYLKSLKEDRVVDIDYTKER